MKSFDPSSYPAPLGAEVPAGQAVPAPGLSLKLVAGLLGLLGVLLAISAAYAFNNLAGFGAVWSAAAAAVLGVLAACVPLVALLGRHASAPAFAETGGLASLPGMGLARPMFMDLAEREWSRARRYGSGVAVLLVDVDRPARLAESAGPAAADSMLKALIELSGPGLRPADMITRFGSQRMAVFLAPADPTGALDVAERIRERAERLELSKPRSTVFQSAPAPALAKVTVSIGVAHMRPAHLNLQAMLDDADDALVAAREAGGNCVRAAPVDAGRLRGSNRWTGDDRRAWPKQGGSA